MILESIRIRNCAKGDVERDLNGLLRIMEPIVERIRGLDVLSRAAALISVDRGQVFRVNQPAILEVVAFVAFVPNEP